MDVRTVIISQYQAGLAMLKQTILACPDSLWYDPTDQNKSSQIAYHTLFYTHLYLQESEDAFRLWHGHREDYRLAGGDAGASAEPATKALVLEYLAFCQQQVVEKIPATDLDAASGFHWLNFTKLELQLYSIRHIQHHVGELMERLGPHASELDWIGSVVQQEMERAR